MTTQSWADALAESDNESQQQSQLQPRPSVAGGRPPAANGPIAVPIPGGGNAPPPKPAKSPGLIDRAITAAKQTFAGPADLNPFSAGNLKSDADAVSSIGAGVLRAPGQFLGGLLDTDADVGKFVGDNIVAPLVRATGASPQLTQRITSAVTAGAGSSAQRLSRMGGNGGASLADVLSNRQGLGQVGNPAVNQFVNEGVAASLPLALTGGGGMGVSALKAAVGGAIALSRDPNHPLLSRLENAGIAGATDVGFGLAGKLLSKATKVVPATADEAAKDALDRSFATQRTTDARYAQLDPKASAELAADQEVTSPSRHTDQETTPDGQTSALDQGSKVQDGSTESQSPPPHPLATDANAALDKSGAAERIPTDGTHELTPDGKLLVDPATKATLDGQGLGRAFEGRSIAEDTGAPGKDPHIFLKETDAQGGQRVVGSISQDDLNGFLKDAEHFRKNPDEIYQNSSHPTGQWSLPKLGSSDDVGALARAMSDYIEGIPKRTNAADLAEATVRVTGMDLGDVERFVGSTASDGTRVREATLAARMFHQKSMQELRDLPDVDYSKLEPNDPLVQAAIARVHNAMTIHTHLNTLKSEAGAALQLHGVDLNSDPLAQGLKLQKGDEIPPDPLPDADAYKESFGKTPDQNLPPKDPRKGPGLPRTPKELDNWKKLFDAADNMEDPVVSNRMLNGQPISLDKWMYFRNSYVNNFTASIISAPRTFVRDAWGPAIVSGYNTVGRALGNGINAINPLLSDAERSAAWAASWSAPRAYIRTVGDALDALKQAGATVARQYKQAPGADSFPNPVGSNLGSSHTLLGGHSPLDFNTQGVPSAVIHAATLTDPGVTGAVPFYLGNMLNKWPQIIQSLHGGVNELAQRLSYMGDVRASAYQEAATRGLQGSDFDSYVKQRLDQSIDPVSGEATDASALSNAERTTFTRRPVPGQDPMALTKAMQIRSDIIKEVPEARFIIPIFTVPANALGEMLRRVPILNIIGQETRNELSGAAGVVAQGDAYGRMLTGGASLLAGFGLARSGALTGSGPSEPVARRVWAQTHQPYSIRVGDHWWSYSKSDIVGPMLGMIAGAYDHTVYHPGDETQGAHVMGAAMGIAEYIKDQASLKALSDVLNIGGNPQESQGILNRLGGGIVSGGLVPNFVEQLARESRDDISRVKRNPMDYIVDRLPYLSEKLDPTTNVLGEPVHKPSSPGLNTFPVSIANVNTYAKDPVLDEMARAQQTAGYSPGVLPQSAGNGTHADLRDIKAEDGYSVYYHIMRQLTSVKNDQGQTLRDKLLETIQSPEYAQAPDGKGKSLDETGDSQEVTRGGIMAKDFSDFHKLAKQAAARESPMVARILAAATAKSHDLVNLGKYPVAHLATDAGDKLMGSLGIDIRQYEDTAKGNP